MKVKGMTFEKDVPIPMRDGLELAANIYRPEKPGNYPVIMAFTGFGKDVFWSGKFPGWEVAYEPWSPTVSGSITFEANDPAFWVPSGYAVIIVDPRGFARSPGAMPKADVDGENGECALLREGRWARDMYDAIEWAGTREWCNGSVGLSGVSILAFSQWRAAALNPPHLKAINPWSGMTDFYRDVMFPGGIPETKFSRPTGLIELIRAPHNPAWPAPEKENPQAPDVKEEDEFLAEVTVPTLICATWVDHGCHCRGAFRAWRKIASKHKWLYTSGRNEWAEFYSSSARAFRKMFFDCFLKGADTRMLDTPRVRMEVWERLDQYTVRWEDDFPIAHTQYRRMYLDAAEHQLKFDLDKKERSVSYDSLTGKTTFDFTFEQDTELTGYKCLKLWVSSEDGDDMDLFTTLRKLDTNGNEVYFDSWITPEKWPVALGWLRLSHRELDGDKSTPWEPYLKRVVGSGEKVKAREIVRCEIPILPSATLFRMGETLRLEVSGLYRGGERIEVPYAYAGEMVNKGTHTIYAGGNFDSHLLIPLVRPKTA